MEPHPLVLIRSLSMPTSSLIPKPVRDTLMEDWHPDTGFLAPSILALFQLAGLTLEQASQRLEINQEELYGLCWRMRWDPRAMAGISELFRGFGFDHARIWGRNPSAAFRTSRVPAAFRGVPSFQGELDPERHALILLADCETSGPNAELHRAVEVAALKVVVDRRPWAGSRFLGAYDGYVGLQDPGPHPVNPVSMRVHGIPLCQLHGQNLDEAALDRVLSDVCLVVAHNASFDRRFLTKAVPALKGFYWSCSYHGVDWKAFGCKAANLKTLCKHFSLPVPGHRAADDAVALYRLLEQTMPDGKTAFRLLAEGLVPLEGYT